MNNLTDIEPHHCSVRTLIKNAEACGISGGSFQQGNTCGAVEGGKKEDEPEEKAPEGKPAKFYPSIGSKNSARSNLSKGTVSYSDRMFDRHSKNMVEKGNIPLNQRPKVKNDDGTISTVRSITIEQDGKHILLPTVVGDKVVSDKEAIDHYQKTKQQLGVFRSASHAQKYANDLHKAQERDYTAKDKKQEADNARGKTWTKSSVRKEQADSKRENIKAMVKQQALEKRQTYEALMAKRKRS